MWWCGRHSSLIHLLNIVLKGSRPGASTKLYSLWACNGTEGEQTFPESSNLYKTPFSSLVKVLLRTVGVMCSPCLNSNGQLSYGASFVTKSIMLPIISNCCRHVQEQSLMTLLLNLIWRTEVDARCIFMADAPIHQPDCALFPALIGCEEDISISSTSFLSLYAVVIWIAPS